MGRDGATTHSSTENPIIRAIPERVHLSVSPPSEGIVLELPSRRMWPLGLFFGAFFAVFAWVALGQVWLMGGSGMEDVFALAVPFVVFCVIVGVVFRSYAERRGTYGVLWGLTVAGLVDQWGAVALTFLVSALLLLPFFTVCVGVIMLYTFAVHARMPHTGTASARSRWPAPDWIW